MRIKDLTIVYTLAPRTPDTINESIKSLRANWIDNKIFISAEPWKYKIKDKNVDMIIHKKKKWCFLHYDWVLNQKKFLKTKYLFIIQDDYVFSERINELVKFKDKWFWFYNFYLSEQLLNTIPRIWRNDIRFGWSTAWACFLFDTEMIPKIISSFFYQNHKNEYVKKIKNQQVDSCIWETCKLLNLKTYFPSISYCKHIWESVIWHSDWTLWLFNFAQCEIDGYRWRLDKVIIWIASIPEREKLLENTIISLYEQVDKIILGLNGYKKKPIRLKKYKKVQVISSDNSKGDIMKFIDIEKVSWYYFTCDDDIIYPSDYVDFMINWIERNERKMIVWLHWVIVPWKIKSYYYDCQRFHYASELRASKVVHILWTWTTAFHTDTIKLKVSDFWKANMADIWLGKKAQESNVLMICLARTQDFIKQQEVKESIWEKYRNNDNIQTAVVNSVIRRPL